MGPFYCPTDKTVYVDLSFWNDLKTQFGADSGTFTQAYVLAHEYGHHVQDLLGTSDRRGYGNGSDVRLGPVGVAGRLLRRGVGQARHHRPRLGRPGADHRHHPERRGRSHRHRRPRSATTGSSPTWEAVSVDPSQFSHGTAQQRQKWFTTGWDSGDPAKCDTFAAKSLG